MPEKWTCSVVAKMHQYRITVKELGDEVGWTRSYISMILNGQRTPEGARARITEGLDRCVKRRKEELRAAKRYA